jgi:Uma2 family endonuclease
MRQVLVTRTLKPEGMSEEEFFQFCVANKDIRVEKNSSGEILIMPPTGSETGIFDAGLTSEISAWNKKTKAGKVFGSSAGFTLPNKAVRSPDAAWISSGRWDQVAEDDRKKFAHICPDFIAEIAPPSDSVMDLQVKMEEWMENGCRLGWLIHPERKKVYVYTAGEREPEVLPFGKIIGGDILPGLEVDLNELFEI